MSEVGVPSEKGGFCITPLIYLAKYLYDTNAFTEVCAISISCLCSKRFLILKTSYLPASLNTPIFDGNLQFKIIIYTSNSTYIRS
jgi:hypothetical protein